MDDPLFPATAMPDRDWWEALWPDPAQVLRRLGIGPGQTVLDLCCGDGYFTAPLSALVEGRVYALDLSQAMLDQARAEVARLGVPEPQWLCADARELARVLPEPVDCVLIANTFHGVPEPEALASAVAAVLKPGGTFVVVNWYARPREETPVLGKPRGPRDALRMSPERTRTVVEPAGFRLARVVELPPYHYGAVFARQTATDAEHGQAGAPRGNR